MTRHARTPSSFFVGGWLPARPVARARARRVARTGGGQHPTPMQRARSRACEAGPNQRTRGTNQREAAKQNQPDEKQQRARSRAREAEPMNKRKATKQRDDGEHSNALELEPRREVAWVAAAERDPLAARGRRAERERRRRVGVGARRRVECVDVRDESREVGERLLRREVDEALDRHVRRRARLAVEAVLAIERKRAGNERAIERGRAPERSVHHPHRPRARSAGASGERRNEGEEGWACDLVHGRAARAARAAPRFWRVRRTSRASIRAPCVLASSYMKRRSDGAACGPSPPM